MPPASTTAATSPRPMISRPSAAARRPSGVPGAGNGCATSARRHLDRLADAVHRLEVVAGGDHAGAQLLEGDALEVKALEQRGEVRWYRPARDLHHGSP